MGAMRVRCRIQSRAWPNPTATQAVGRQPFAAKDINQSVVGMGMPTDCGDRRIRALTIRQTRGTLASSPPFRQCVPNHRRIGVFNGFIDCQCRFGSVDGFVGFT